MNQQQNVRGPRSRRLLTIADVWRIRRTWIENPDVTVAGLAKRTHTSNRWVIGCLENSPNKAPAWCRAAISDALSTDDPPIKGVVARTFYVQMFRAGRLVFRNGSWVSRGSGGRMVRLVSRRDGRRRAVPIR